MHLVGRARAVEENAGVGASRFDLPNKGGPGLIWKTLFISKLVMVMGPVR